MQWVFWSHLVDLMTLCFHRLRRLRPLLGRPAAPASGRNLIVASIILWNTVYIERVIHLLLAPV